MNLVPLRSVVAIDRDQRNWSGRPYVGMENIESGTGRLVADDPLLEVKSTTFGFDNRHVLYGRLRPYLNKVLLPGFEGHCSTEIIPLIPSKAIDRRYLWYWLTSAQTVDAIDDTCTGARMPRANMDRVLDLLIPLPPIEEQLRIVAVLDEAFAAIATATANAEKNLANAHLIIQSAIDRAFLDVGADHESKSLSALIDVTHGYAFDGAQFETSDDQRKPIVLTPGNYTENADLSFTKKNTKRLICGSERAGFRLNVGDLTVVMTDLSSRMKILGRPAFVNADNILHNQRIGRVVLKSDDVILRLIYYYMQTSNALSRIRDTATGTMVRHTAPKRILSGVISYPRLREVQSALVVRLDAISLETRTFANQQVAKIAHLAEFKQSLLRSAFAGEYVDRELEALAA